MLFIQNDLAFWLSFILVFFDCIIQFNTSWKLVFEITFLFLAHVPIVKSNKKMFGAGESPPPPQTVHQISKLVCQLWMSTLRTNQNGQGGGALHGRLGSLKPRTIPQYYTPQCFNYEIFFHPNIQQATKYPWMQ